MSRTHKKKSETKRTSEVVEMTQQSVTVIDDGWSRRRFVQKAAKAIVAAGGGAALLNLAKIDSVFAAEKKDSKLQSRALRRAFKSDAEYEKAKEAIKIESAGQANSEDSCACGATCTCSCPCTCSCACSDGCQCTCTCECKCDCGCYCPCMCEGCNCSCTGETVASVYAASFTSSLWSGKQTPDASGVGPTKTSSINNARTPARDGGVQGSFGPGLVAINQAEQTTAVDATISSAGDAQVVSTKSDVGRSATQADAAAGYTWQSSAPSTSKIGTAALLVGLGGLGWHYLRKKASQSESAA